MARTPATLSRLTTGDGSPAAASAHRDPLAALAAAVAAIHQVLDVQFTRIAQMQAQLDALAKDIQSRGRKGS